MNKQQLANKIWESANKMRSKIEANEYKDYILGFIFYKYLSDQEYTGRGVFTIVEEADGKGATKWGRLKSGAGWISLDFIKIV